MSKRRVRSDSAQRDSALQCLNEKIALLAARKFGPADSCQRHQAIRRPRTRPQTFLARQAEARRAVPMPTISSFAIPGLHCYHSATSIQQ